MGGFCSYFFGFCSYFLAFARFFGFCSYFFGFCLFFWLLLVFLAFARIFLAFALWSFQQSSISLPVQLSSHLFNLKQSFCRSLYLFHYFCVTLNYDQSPDSELDSVRKQKTIFKARKNSEPNPIPTLKQASKAGGCASWTNANCCWQG